MVRAGALALALGVLAGTALAEAEPAKAELLDFDDLPGWSEDDHAAAFAAFRVTCPMLRQAEWAAVCAFAATDPDPRRFFELFFRPVRMGDGAPGLFTGYYEPELRASAVRTPSYRWPVHRRPPDLVPGTPWLTRSQILGDGALDGQGLEIAWLRDPVDLYHLQLQGSGRLRLTDGRVIRVGYAARNGHARRSLAAELVARGAVEPHQASTDVLRAWVRRNPAEGRALLMTDPSYVFFRVLERHPPGTGPIGAMNRPLTAGRSLAVDPAHVPLGAPVWVETEGADPLRRLMVAQDTGGAIKGVQRGDVFFGTGSAAGRSAAVVRDPGRMVMLLPIELAFARAPGL